jgi:hypothetical protein
LPEAPSDRWFCQDRSVETFRHKSLLYVSCLLLASKT